MQKIAKLVFIFVSVILGGCAVTPLDASESTGLQSASVAGESDTVASIKSSDTTMVAESDIDQKSTAQSHLIDQYKIGVDDVVQVSVWRNPELSVTVPVRPDGKISVPLIGDVQAGGLTPRQVAATVQKKLSHYVRDPQVAIILTQLKSHEFLSRVRVTGAIKTPTSIPYRQGMTVLDVVLAAGGINEFASPNKAKIYRKKDGKTETLRVRLEDILNKGNLDTNYNLEPGDVITVPERLF